MTLKFVQSYKGRATRVHHEVYGADEVMDFWSLVDIFMD